MTWWIVGSVLLVAGAGVPAGWTWRRSRMDTAHARALSQYEQLGYAVQTTDAGERALARATERWNSAGAALAQARCDADYAIVERIAREGMECLGA
jgi:predicted negative regulator of RcsB-dependent stress response